MAIRRPCPIFVAKETQAMTILQKLFLSALFLLLLSPVQAQKVWTLEECIDHALQNSIGVRQADLAVEQAVLSKKQAVQSVYPSLNAGVNGGVQFGRTIDPTTNTFNTQNIYYNSFSLQTGMPVFSGGLRYFTIQQSHLQIEAARYEAAALEQDISMSVATAYLNILLNYEQVAAAEKAVELAQLQLAQTEKLIAAGNLPANDRLEMEAQLASAEQNLVLVQNALDQSYLQLRHLLLLPPEQELEIARPDLPLPENPDPLVFSDEAVFQSALQTQPRIQADAYLMQSAAKGTQIAKARLWPSLSFFGQLNTNWSSAARRVAGSQLVYVPVEVRLPDGSTQTFEFAQEVPVLADNPYLDQLDQNFGQGFGLSLQIPIYNASSARIGVQRARLNEMDAYLRAAQNRQNLQTSIQNAVANARSGKKAYEAAQRTLESAKASYENASKKFALGAINSYELNATKTRLDQARADALRAKYSYIFYLKLVDFYLGKPLTLN